MTALLDSLAQIVGPAGLLTDPDDVAPYLLDWRKRYEGRALAIVRPGSTTEVAAIVRLCHDNRVGIVPQGGNTGLAGGATPDTSGSQVLLSLRRMNRVRAIDARNSTLTVEAGCTLAAVQSAAAGAERLFPLSLAAEGSCTIGGNLATNAGGTGVLRYGNTRELTLGLEVVLANGEVWDGLRGLRKNNTGYDLRQIFIGCEGTLGIITAAVLKLFPLPRGRATALAAVASPNDALDLLSHCQSLLGSNLTGFEIFSDVCLGLVLRYFPEARLPLASRCGWYALVEVSDSEPDEHARSTLESALAKASEGGGIVDAVVAASAGQADELWALRENISEAQAREGKNIKHDVSLPVSALPEFIATTERALAIAAPGVRVVCFGHLGDGNLHFNISPPPGAGESQFLEAQPLINRIVHDHVAARDGSISAEHGIGQLRREELRRYKSEIELSLMRRLKDTLDPLGILNPGKVL